MVEAGMNGPLIAISCFVGIEGGIFKSRRRFTTSGNRRDLDFCDDHLAIATDSQMITRRNPNTRITSYFELTSVKSILMWNSSCLPWSDIIHLQFLFWINLRISTSNNSFNDQPWLFWYLADYSFNATSYLLLVYENLMHVDRGYLIRTKTNFVQIIQNRSSLSK